MEIFEEIRNALQEEEEILVATIISTTGSTPAAELSKMIVRNQGLTTVGTIGGGCLEAEVITWARDLYGRKEARVKTFHLNEDNAETGLICGGSLEVLIEPIDQSFLPVLEQVMDTKSQGEDGALVTILQNNSTIAKCFVHGDGITGLPANLNLCAKGLRSAVFMAGASAGGGEHCILESARKVLQTREAARFQHEAFEIIIEPVAGQPNLIIFGGGHVSKFVSRFASQVGFRVTIIDDRVAFANKERFPEASEVVCDDFLKAIDRLKITSNTYIAIITRGHKFDEVILERLIHSNAKYIGVIGSKRKILTAYRHYLHKGIPREAMERIHAPIGIDIGAVTAEEIGISIVAELVWVRRGGSHAVPLKSKGMPELIAALEEKVRKAEF